MKKEQLHLILGIATPLLLVTILLLQLHHGQQNLTRAIVSLHTGREAPAPSRVAGPEPLTAMPPPSQEEKSPDAVPPPAPSPPTDQPQPPQGGAEAPPSPTPPPHQTNPLAAAAPLPGELIERPELSTRPGSSAVHLTYQPVTINHIYPRLQAFGRWFVHPRHGNVWMPHTSRRNRQWRPYGDNGKWYYTQIGWHWQSNYKWGGTAFHHGRWFWDGEKQGWVWVPGREWSPAWVTWRESGDRVGWAPIPPIASTASSPTASSRPTGTSGLHIDYGLDNTHFTFVPKADFLSPSPVEFALSGEDAVTAFQNSRSRDRISLNAQRQWTNYGISRREMAHAIGSPIELVNVDLRNPFQPRILTQQDLEAAAAKAQEQLPEKGKGNSQSPPTTTGVVFRPPSTTYWPGAQEATPSGGTGPAGFAAPAPIVIEGAPDLADPRRRKQTSSPRGLGFRRGQVRPNLSVRQSPKK